MQNGLVEKFRALTATRFVQFFAFNFDRQFLANHFSSPPPSLEAYPLFVPPTSNPTPKSTCPCPQKTTKRLQTSIVFSNPCRQHQLSGSTTSIFSHQARGGKLLNWGASWAIGQTRNPHFYFCSATRGCCPPDPPILNGGLGGSKLNHEPP